MSVDAETNTEKIIRRAGRPWKTLTPEELEEKIDPKKQVDQEKKSQRKYKDKLADLEKF